MAPAGMIEDDKVIVAVSRGASGARYGFGDGNETAGTAPKNALVVDREGGFLAVSVERH
jgi:hypothetical protein